METRICYRSSFSCEKYVSVWRGCGTQCSHEANEGHPISPHALTNARCHDSTIGHLRAFTEPVKMVTLGGGHRTRTNGDPWGRSPNPYKCSGQSPQPNWRLP